MKGKKIRLFFLLAAGLSLFSCDYFSISTPVILPPELTGTAVKQTSAALSILTAESMPSPTITPRPSQTPRPSESRKPADIPSVTTTATATWIRPTYTLTNIPDTRTPGHVITPRDESCTLASQKPADNTSFPPNTVFSVIWRVVNDTYRIWDEHEVDFKYINGRKMYVGSDFIDLPATTGPGERVSLVVNMKAPSTQGTYKTEWALKEGNNTFCLISLTIQVK